MIFDYHNEHLVTVLCFNVVISNLRGSQELGLFTYTVPFKLQQAAAWLQGLGSQTVQVCVPVLHLISTVTLNEYLTTLCLSFFFYKLGIIVVLNP